MRQLISSRTGIIVAGLIGLGGYYLWSDYPAQFFSYLPLALVLGVCLGMHFFMHGSHGSDQNSSDNKSEGDS